LLEAKHDVMQVQVKSTNMTTSGTGISRGSPGAHQVQVSASLGTYFSIR